VVSNTRDSLLVVGVLIGVLVAPWLIGYGKAQKTILGAVPDYLVRCVPNWSVVSWYRDQELFISVDEFERYLEKGCGGAERLRYPPGQYISNSVVVFLQHHLDRWYFMGYQTGEDHALKGILPAWNRIVNTSDLTGTVFVSILALVVAGGCAFGFYILRRVI